MLHLVIAFFLALIPFFTLKGAGEGIRTPKEIATIVGLIIISGIGFYYKKIPFKSKCLILFLGWCFLTTFFNGFNIPVWLPKNIIVEMPVTFFAWKPLFYITLSIFTIYTIASVKNRPENYKFLSASFSTRKLSVKDEIKNISSVITWVVIVMCVYSIIQAIGLDNFFRVCNQWGDIAKTNTDLQGITWHFHHRVVGTIGNPSLLAVWLSMCIPFTLYLRSIRGYTGFGLIIVALIMTFSTTAIISAITVTMFYLLFKHFKIFICIFLVIVMLVSIGFYKKVDFKRWVDPTGRIEIHKEVWEILKQRPLLGYGLGSFEYMVGLNPAIVKRAKDECWRSLHDEYGEIWFECGLIGLALFLGFIFTVIFNFIKNLSDESITLASSLAGFLLISLTLFPMRLGETAFYGIVFTGLLLKSIRRNE